MNNINLLVTNSLYEGMFSHPGEFNNQHREIINNRIKSIKNKNSDIELSHNDHGFFNKIGVATNHVAKFNFQHGSQEGTRGPGHLQANLDNINGHHVIRVFDTEKVHHAHVLIRKKGEKIGIGIKY